MRRLAKAVAAALVLAGCSPERSIVGRTSDPTGELDAVRAEVLTDATVATPLEIYVVAKGARISGDPIFRADKVVKLRVVWLNASEVEIQADEARIFLHQHTTSVDGRAITLKTAIKKKHL
ncbi:hypothetical protein [Hansschlegelia zhihuaiae]|uniref:Uncharacterized protein n=1 Tax=Hansschlegelia zhihuaiae TaxID=405005 RepID=A0A4Q0MI72_9HYPH|nr:hypothetical protein [Hansschlegelia zhihuaiae]RXF73013.1 hypothetical protein EK403_12825 [Hansschlegelia zhihuaiae]